jgi:hypothetical protein
MTHNYNFQTGSVLKGFGVALGAGALLVAATAPSICGVISAARMMSAPTPLNVTLGGAYILVPVVAGLGLIAALTAARFSHSR